jgi:Na+-transporting NADH:ubiquinone oxidoreductase subunit B
MFFGFIPGSLGVTSTLAILIGAIFLIWTGVGSWKIMLSGVLGALSLGFLFQWLGVIHPDIQNAYFHIPAYYHLVMGGFAFGIVFMATDPVSAAQTEKGKWVYGFLIGIFAVLIRALNPAYPEGVMLAILLLNAWASLIDHYVIEANIKKRLKRAKI